HSPTAIRRASSCTQDSVQWRFLIIFFSQFSAFWGVTVCKLACMVSSFQGGEGSRGSTDELGGKQEVAANRLAIRPETPDDGNQLGREVGETAPGGGLALLLTPGDRPPHLVGRGEPQDSVLQPTDGLAVQQGGPGQSLERLDPCGDLAAHDLLV